MSKSIRKNIILIFNSRFSEKKDKRFANRSLRRLVNVKILKQQETLPLLKEVSNIWDFTKDGKMPWIGSTKNNKFTSKFINYKK